MPAFSCWFHRLLHYTSSSNDAATHATSVHCWHTLHCLTYQYCYHWLNVSENNLSESLIATEQCGLLLHKCMTQHEERMSHGLKIPIYILSWDVRLVRDVHKGGMA